MNIQISAQPKKAKEMPFRFGNIQSRYGANSLYFTRDGQPFMPLSGEFHFSRCPRREWKQELLKMQALGLNMAATYVFWNHHESRENCFDFSGDRDIHAFLAVCKEIDMPCLLRIGPWCHGEVVYGGLPKYVNRMPGKRRDTPRYLAAVRRYFARLYREIQDFMDGETVIGIQLENEYGGPISHMRTLRKIAEEIGFQTSFFTMTAWPGNQPNPHFLPMMGGYPEAPWTQHKRPLGPNRRFAITPHKTEAEIGGDLVKTSAAQKGVFDDYPYAGCEVGPGNQVTQHRRPIISDKDGYGVGFAKFASGMNWLGYYMFHGGRNPNDGLYQESRRTLYPNNYPIIDYDFQAPVDRYGYFRKSAHRLRLLHTFINSFDPAIAAKPAYFPDLQPKSAADSSMPTCSVRMDEDLSGYCFLSSYERGLVYPNFRDLLVTLRMQEHTLQLPAIDLPTGSMFFYPFNLTLEGRRFDYITAQPIAKVEQQAKTDVYFMVHPGIRPVIKAGEDCITDIRENAVGYSYDHAGKAVKLHFLSEERALAFYLFGDQVLFSSGTLYAENQTITAQAPQNTCLKASIQLKQTGKRRLPYNSYLYSYGKRKYYQLNIDAKMLDEYYDVELTFAFSGLNLQVFSGTQLVDDCFNTDGYYRICLRQYKEYLLRNPALIIRTAPQTRFGVGRVYNEIGLGYENGLRLVKAVPVQERKRGGA